MDASYIIYTGVNTPYIPITSGQALDVILRNIDTAINAHNTAPDYSGYNLYCIKQVDGTTHPTNTQNFAEGISKNVCDFNTTYTTFVGTTYVSDQSVITTAITGLQDPGLTYSTFSITNTDTVTQVWNKTFTGLTGIINSITPTAANWSTLSITPPTTTVGAWNSIIAYEVTQNTAIASKEPSIGTFNNSSNCLAGGATDTPRTTIGDIITYICTLPGFDSDSMTSTCVSAGTDLQSWLQNTVNQVESLTTGTVRTNGTGLALSGSGCGGKTLSVDTTWTGLYKVSVDSSDTTPANLYAKLAPGAGISLTIQNVSGNENILITNTEPEAGFVKVNSSDAQAGYLASKIPSSGGNWGLAIMSTTSADNSQLILTPTIINPGLFAQQFMAYVASDPIALAQWCSLNTLCAGCTCAAPTGLSVVVTTS